MLASSGTLSVPAASTSAIVTAHGLGATPQCVVFFGFGGPSTGQRDGTQEFCFGAMDGTRQFGSGSTVPDNQTTGDLVAMVNNTSEVLMEVEATGNTVTGRVPMTSVDATNFTITPSDAFVSDRFVTWIALAGLTNAFVDAFMMTAASGSFSRVAPNFWPSGALVVMPNTASTMNTVGQRAHYSVGATDGARQWCAQWAREEGTTNYTIGAMLTDAVAAHSVNASSFIERISFTSFDATGYTMNRVNGNSARPLCVICFQGGNPMAGTFAARTGSAGLIHVPTPGHRSKFFFMAGRPPATAADSAPVEPGEVAYGVVTGMGQRQTWWKFDHNAEPISGGSPTDAISRHDNNLAWRTFTRTGTSTIAEAQSMDISGIAHGAVVLNQTVVDANATIIGYFSLGDAEVGGIEFPPAPRTSRFDDITHLMTKPFDWVPAVNLGMSPYMPNALRPSNISAANLARLGLAYRSPQQTGVVNPANAAFTDNRRFNRVLDAGSAGAGSGSVAATSGTPDRRRRAVAVYRHFLLQ